jgi:hypothetical protein
MAGPFGRGARGSQDNPAEAPAIDAARIVAGLRWRLQHQEILEHPKVLSELRKLYQQVAEQLESADPNPGRHRSTAGNEIGDAPGFDLKPDPLAATTPAEFVQALWQFKAWFGDPSWRKMAEQAGQAVVHSTMYAAMNGDALPKLEVVKAIIIGCGGAEDDLRSFTSAWRRLDAARTQNLAERDGVPSAPDTTSWLHPARDKPQPVT